MSEFLLNTLAGILAAALVGFLVWLNRKYLRHVFLKVRAYFAEPRKVIAEVTASVARTSNLIERQTELIKHLMDANDKHHTDMARIRRDMDELSAKVKRAETDLATLRKLHEAFWQECNEQIVSIRTWVGQLQQQLPIGMSPPLTQLEESTHAIPESSSEHPKLRAPRLNERQQKAGTESPT
jgi:hypothetical protein